MTDSPDIPAFGVVDPDGEHGILSIEMGGGALCRLTLVSRTERGYPRHELAVIPQATWRQLANATQKELLRGMDPEEIGPKTPSFRSGDQALSPLITRELSVLLWSLMEDGEGTHIDALLAGWRQLAREERWWLYARASNPTQRQGRGWRRALFYALTDPADTRTAPRLLEIMEAASAQKKTSGPMPSVNYRKGLRRIQGSKKTSGKTDLPETTPVNEKPGKLSSRNQTQKPAAKAAAKKAAPSKAAKKATKKMAPTKAAKKSQSTPKPRK